MEGECGICFERYDSSHRLPKITDCGHTFCLACLQMTPRNCSTCRKIIHKKPEDMITNFDAFTASHQSDNQYCDACKKIAVRQCQLDAHPVRNLKAFLQKKIQAPLEALKAYACVLEKVTPYVLQMQDIARDQLNEVMSEGDKCKDLCKVLGKYADDGMVNQLDKAMCQVEDYTKGQHLLECGLQLGNIKEGMLTMELQCQGNGGGDGGSTFVASLNLQAVAAECPDVLAATQVLMYLLSRHGNLQSRKKNVQTGDGRMKPSSPSKPKPQERGTSQANINQQSRHRSVDSGQYGQQQNASAIPPEITKDGVLDLGPPSRIGAAPYGEMTSDKRALLRTAKMVRELKGPVECAADPEFSKLLLEKHRASLENVDLRRVQSDHFKLLGSMPKIKNLKVVGCDGRLADFPPHPVGCGLRSLYVHLPLAVQLAVWKAFAQSVQTVTLRIEAGGVVDVHLSLKPCVDASPKLNSLQLHRKDAKLHTTYDCEKQIGLVRRVVPDSVRVTCNMCRHQQ